MPIEDRDLEPGTRLVARYKGAQHVCIVGEGPDGRRTYTLGDGRSFTSLSAAGSAVMGGIACNGWRFWSVARLWPVAAEPAITEPPLEPEGGVRCEYCGHWGQTREHIERCATFERSSPVIPDRWYCTPGDEIFGCAPDPADCPSHPYCNVCGEAPATAYVYGEACCDAHRR